MTSVLEVRHGTKRFGGLVALRDVDLAVEEDEVLGLIGPNGAGKTTLFNCLTGLDQWTSGEARYRDRLLPRRAHQITHSGLARTFQNIRLFPNMTAVENVLVGRHCRTSAGVLSAVGRGAKFRHEERESEARALELLEFVGLTGTSDVLARHLSYGRQRQLEIARALATDPGVLLLDEPTAGMNHQERSVLMDLVRAIRHRGLSIVVIEHDMRFVFDLCDRVAVLVHGQKLVEGPPGVVREDPRVIEAYLGSAPT